MATKTTSRKTTASARATPKKPNSDSPKPAKTAAAAKNEKAKTPRVAVPASSAQGEIKAQAARPAKAKAKAAPRRLKNEEALEAKTQAEAVTAPLEVVPPAPARPTRNEIAARAAALWRQNGGPAFDNWIRAERELGA